MTPRTQSRLASAYAIEKTVVLMFKDRFAALVKDHTKTHTIRPMRKRPVKAGDLLSLRRWTGAAYRTKQEILMRARCSSIGTIEIGVDWIRIEGRYLDESERETLAQHDGFTDSDDMIAWFMDTHGLPFSGVLINWVPL